MDPELLWYVAYGSNLSLARLQRYLSRCSPLGDPLDRRPVRLPHRLFFAHESRLWTGGSAFVDPEPDPSAGTLATAWLLRFDQFLGVLAGENACERVAEAVEPRAIAPAETVRVDAGRYGLVVGCESPDARPALTFTTSEQPLPEPTVPSRRYVDTIVSGLVDGHGLTEGEARDYLAARTTG